MDDDLAAFLNARLDEDEAALEADAAGDGLCFVDADEQSERFIWRFADEGRVRCELAAKRARLALMDEAVKTMDRLLADKHAGAVDQAMAIGRARAATVAVKHDAAIWSDDPGYRPEWAPPG